MKRFISNHIIAKDYQNPLPALRVGQFSWVISNKSLVYMLGLLLISNAGSISWGYFKEEKKAEALYLIDKAAAYVDDLPAFEGKVREVSAQLDVPPEWLMAVMYSESRFDAAVKNLRGSGATGLIQFMPNTARDLGTSVQAIEKLNHVEQLDWVRKYMQLMRDKYGEYETVTDFYLAILYPKARGQELCYSMYATPSKAYKQNSGLDLDKDGQVTVGEIDKRLKKLFPTAYIKQKPKKKTPEMMAEKE